MKKQFFFFSSAVLACVVIILSQSCNKDLPVNLAFDSYVYSTIDSNAGNWEPVYLTGTSLVSITAPDDVTSSTYLSELDATKNSSSSLTDDQQSAVDYWGNNTMIRWIEIASELAAKYNLPPEPDATGYYGVPDPVFPATYPYFPFSHPPYACRMFAYLSAASYDALLTAWHYKYLYNRKAPYIIDPSVTHAYPDNHIPSYPSEDAVIASVAEDVLTFMYPLEESYIETKAQELRNTRIWGGMNVQSDIDAGDSIGHTIADIFIGRAKTDSMKYAQVEEDEYIEIEQAADALWSSQWPHWENLEDPQRPIGITPKFGHVVPWFIPGVEAIRPGPPPAVGSALYKEADDELRNYTDNLSHEQEETAFFWSDGAGTYTPPGHWNWLANQCFVQYQVSPVRTARIMAYMNMAMEDAGISCWDTKYYYMYPRPPQLDGDINTLFMLPNFPSYPSGHAAFSSAAAEVLSYFFPAEQNTFSQWAEDASDSRRYARIHWNFDCTAGESIGNAAGSYALDAAKVDGAD